MLGRLIGEHIKVTLKLGLPFRPRSRIAASSSRSS